MPELEGKKYTTERQFALLMVAEHSNNDELLRVNPDGIVEYIKVGCEREVIQRLVDMVIAKTNTESRGNMEATLTHNTQPEEEES